MDSYEQHFTTCAIFVGSLGQDIASPRFLPVFPFFAQRVEKRHSLTRSTHNGGLRNTASTSAGDHAGRGGSRCGDCDGGQKG